MNLFSKIIGAASAGFRTFRNVLINPEVAESSYLDEKKMAQYALLWSYYTNDIFNEFSTWGEYINDFRLYRNIRSIYNPVKRIVDFYAGTVYPGRLSISGEPLPDGIRQAIEFSEECSPELRAAVSQFWAWSNWQTQMRTMVRFAAVTGNCLVSLIDDVARQKVGCEVIFPSLICEHELDPYGNLTYYALQYQADSEEKGEPSYTYRQEVDKLQIRTYKDGEPFAYNGVPSVLNNEYGFVPAVWVKHNDSGGDFGSPAFTSLSKIDELNSVASHIHDHVHRLIENPWVMWSDGEIVPAFATDATGEELDPQAQAESLKFLKGKAGGSIETLVGTLSLVEAIEYCREMLKEVEEDNPELSLYRELRAMQQVTAPGGMVMVGDVDARKEEAASNYDSASQSLFRMAVAIAGHRLETGAWQTPGNQQKKFKGFNLDTFAAGGFDGLMILPRPLFGETESTRLANQIQRATYANQVAAYLPDTEVLRIIGYDDADQLELNAESADANSAEPIAQ